MAALSNGVLTDAYQRTGYIASNYQFQFDAPPQAGAIYTAGFSICANDTLALGGSTLWWACASGNFYNLYDRDWAPQCNLVEIDVLPCSGSGSSDPSSSNVSEGEDSHEEMGWGSASPVETPAPSSSAHMCQIADGRSFTSPSRRLVGHPDITDSGLATGQVQHHETPCQTPEVTAAPEGVSSEAPVSQSTDGQIEATWPASAAPEGSPVSESRDGQIEATQKASAAPQGMSSEAPVSESTDGQVEATRQPSAAPQGVSSVAPVSQISDGQIQATWQASAAPQGVSTVAPVSQISDGQIQATWQATAAPQGVSSVAPVSQISDGQIQASSQATVKPQPSTSETQTTWEGQGPESTPKPEGQGTPSGTTPEETPKESMAGESRASAAPGSVVQTNSAASTFSVNWGSRAVTASVTPAWLGGPGGAGRIGGITGGRLVGGASERYQFGSAYAYAAGILGMMFWVM